jgi:hypothetical protein
MNINNRTLCLEYGEQHNEINNRVGTYVDLCQIFNSYKSITSITARVYGPLYV